MAVSGDITVGPVVGVLFDLIGAVALDGYDSGGGYLYHDSRMANLASGLEKHLITDFGSVVVAAFLPVILS